MAKLTVKIKPIFFEEDILPQRCHSCDDIIIGKSFKLYLRLVNKGKILSGKDTGMVLCESCCRLSSVRCYCQQK